MEAADWQLLIKNVAAFILLVASVLMLMRMVMRRWED